MFGNDVLLKNEFAQLVALYRWPVLCHRHSHMATRLTLHYESSQSALITLKMWFHLWSGAAYHISIILSNIRYSPSQSADLALPTCTPSEVAPGVQLSWHIAPALGSRSRLLCTDKEG